MKRRNPLSREPGTAESKSDLDCRRILPTDAEWPSRLSKRSHAFLDVIGNPLLLTRPLTAIFCSSRCTGDAILRATKWVGTLSDDQGLTFIGGFHSAMEKSFLEIFLDGKCRICLCPARSLVRYRIPQLLRSPIESGRLTVVSSLPETIRANSTRSSHHRNQLVADLAEQIIVTHAAEGSRTEEFALTLLQNRRVVYCWDVECKRLIAGGAIVSQINSTTGRASE